MGTDEFALIVIAAFLAETVILRIVRWCNDANEKSLFVMPTWERCLACFCCTSVATVPAIRSGGVLFAGTAVALAIGTLRLGVMAAKEYSTEARSRTGVPDPRSDRLTSGPVGEASPEFRETAGE